MHRTALEPPRLLTLALAFALPLAHVAAARAEENPQPPSCPFPRSDDGGDARPYDADGDYDPPADAAAPETGGAYEDPFGYEASDDGSAGSGPGLGAFVWPEDLGARLDGAYGTVDLGGVGFSDPAGTLSLEGSALRVGRVAVAGGELAAELAIGNTLRLGGGVGLYAPVGGEAGGDLGPGRFGRDAASSGPTFLTGFGELSLVQRFGAVTTFAGVRAGLLRAQLSIDSSCGCEGLLVATRPFVGPRIGLRAHLYRALYVQGSLTADLTSVPDYVASVGLGFGRRAR